MTELAPTSSFHYQWTYDVFINFRGEDTRRGFTGNLYNALKNARIRTFLDDKELRRGDEITPTLLKAIESSRMAITVFSKNYASSTFCLNELVKIHQCVHGKHRLVWPIFYDVEPSEVRHQRGNYEQALALHKINPKVDEEMMQSWKLALHKVANISGFHYNPKHEYEYQLIKRIVKEISNKVNRVPLYIAQYPVGIESRIQEMKSLLRVGSNDKVIMVGICGIGGMGKTTMARALYNSVVDIFEDMCFLGDVKGESEKCGLKCLQETLVSKISGVDIKIGDVNEGVEIIKRRVSQKKVLLILDNVDRYEQLEKLAGDCNWFGAGSRIIITTRDMHLLDRHMIERKYHIRAFNSEESLELLNWIFFRNNQVNPSYVNVLNRTIAYAQGLPLALEIIGSKLCGMSISECECALDLYERIPRQEILQILKVSYDGLEQEEQKIFLDIACFFKGEKLEYVKYMLEQFHGFNPAFVIRMLVNKCLLRIDHHNFIEMHDLIQDMGTEIVHQESPEEPGKRSRLWAHKDIAHVLGKNTGTSKVRIIIQNKWSQCIEVNWDGEAFKNMKELKILIFENVKFSESPKYLPNSLQVLKWRGYPSSFLPNFCPKKLLVLDVGNSNLSSLEAIKISDNLSVLNLGDCKYITEIPNLSNLKSLKELDLHNCTNLIEIHDSIGYLPKLEILTVSWCCQLKTFPRVFKLPSLIALYFNCCSSLMYFPEIHERMKITYLSLFGTKIEKLPWSICNLYQLEYLDIKQDKTVIELPNSIFLLPKIKDITVRSPAKFISLSSHAQEQATNWSNQCPNIVDTLVLHSCNISDDFLRTYLNPFTNVTHLDLTGNNFTILPAWIKECRFLWELILNECKQLREVEGLLPSTRISRLEVRNCMSLSLEAKSLLLSEELLGAPLRLPTLVSDVFCVPTTGIPNWFDHTSKGASISFWFRNCRVLPLCHCVLVKPRDGVNHLQSNYSSFPRLYASIYINGIQGSKHPFWAYSPLNGDHLIGCRLDRSYLKQTQLCPKNMWNHVRVDVYAYRIDDLVIEESGVYVIKPPHGMEDITFKDPYQTLDFTSGHEDQFGTRLKEKVGLNKKRTLMEDHNFASSSTAFPCAKRGRYSSINQDDNDAITFQIINNQGHSIEDVVALLASTLGNILL